MTPLPAELPFKVKLMVAPAIGLPAEHQRRGKCREAAIGPLAGTRPGRSVDTAVTVISAVGPVPLTL